MLSLILITLAISTTSLLSLRRVAICCNMVDKPTARKKHLGNVPFIGGLAIYLTILVLSVIQPSLFPNVVDYMICSSILVLTGVIDDKFDISATIRLLILTVLSVWLVNFEGISLDFLGDLTGSGNINLPVGGGIITLLAIIGCISAFNMVDGIDGLLGALASVSFAALSILFYLHGNTPLAYLCVLLVTAMLPYILCNLDLIPKKSFKVFMGDSGSFLIGFTVIWLLMHSSQPNLTVSSPILKPVTALWIIALPLMDMVLVMSRRIRKRKSPFKPDRLHLHHICLRLGLSSRQTLSFITMLAVAHAALGIWGQVNRVDESIMFTLFLGSFLIYVLTMSYIWRVITFIRRTKSAGIRRIKNTSVVKTTHEV